MRLARDLTGVLDRSRDGERRTAKQYAAGRPIPRSPSILDVGEAGTLSLQTHEVLGRISVERPATSHSFIAQFKSNVVGDWVFATRNGTALNQSKVQRSALSRAGHVAGLDREGARPRFHDLRHAFATHLFADLASLSRGTECQLLRYS